MSIDALVQPLADAIATVIGSLLGAPAAVSRADGGEPRWVAQLTVTGPVNGTLHVGLPAGDGNTLAKAIMALDEPPADDSVRDALLEMCSRAIAGLGQQEAFAGLKLTQCVTVDVVPPWESAAFQVTAGDDYAGAVHIWSPAAAPGALARSVQPREEAQASAIPANLDVILDIDLPLAVRFGETEMTLASLTRLGPGSVIDLGRSPDDPVDVLVNGRLIARAEVVVVAGNYGVRITEVVSAADRLRSVSL